MDNLIDGSKPKVVVVSRRESLLGRAVEYLTADGREWVILRAVDSQSAADLVKKVEEASPDTVVISRDEHTNDQRLFVQLLRDCMGLKKVVVVSLQENMIEVYCKQRIQVKSAQDLFSEIEKQFSIG